MTDHHSDVASPNFSASVTAATTMRYRKDPAGNLESNTLVYKWSDGSTTLCIGDQHYELQTKPLAPPRDSKPYLEVQDSHSYLATPSVTAQLLGLFGHMTNEYTVRPNKDIEDDALDRLQKSLAAAARKGNDKNGPELIINQEDPELQKKRAEMAEKEQMRLQRRRETAAEKASQSGSRRGAGTLTVDDLEGGRRRGPATGRKPPGAKRPRRRPEYDSDDDSPQGRGGENEYDKGDDFLAPSDEEIEEGGDDDDEEEILEDESDREEPKAKKQKTSKPEELSDADADAEADLDDDEAPAAQASNDGPPGGRGRKRNVIEDDDDDE
jgi:RNA polymerase-associated protein LEO1